jgi:hypothetical protein
VRRLPATTVSYGIEFFADIGFHATVTVMAVYYVQEVGLNPLELVLLGTVSRRRSSSSRFRPA